MKQSLSGKLYQPIVISHHGINRSNISLSMVHISQTSMPPHSHRHPERTLHKAAPGSHRCHTPPCRCQFEEQTGVLPQLPGQRKGWETASPSSEKCLRISRKSHILAANFPHPMACKPSPSWNASDLIPGSQVPSRWLEPSPAGPHLAITLWQMAIKLPVCAWTWTAMPL